AVRFLVGAAPQQRKALHDGCQAEDGGGRGIRLGWRERAQPQRRRSEALPARRSHRSPVGVDEVEVAVSEAGLGMLIEISNKRLQHSRIKDVVRVEEQ